MRDIPGYASFLSVTPFDKGWSNDKKYLVQTAEGARLLLRVSALRAYESKKEHFSCLRKAYALNIPMPEPVSFGLCNGGSEVYTLLSWCPGEDAEAVLPTLEKEKQYALGLRAGELLKALHTVPAPDAQEPWDTRFARKTRMKMEKYRACGLRFEGDAHVTAYLENNFDLLQNRPQSYQHGDYHPGNMVIDGREKLCVIDFDRADFGDPWEEFNRIVWAAAISPHFATGQIDGYFEGRPPLLFFRLLAFYIASNTLSSLYWAMPFGQEQVEVMMRQSQDVLRWFESMENPVPSWYAGAAKARPGV